MVAFKAINAFCTIPITEANFGIIDAKGEAAYYEVNNYSYRRFDVANEPEGYMVVTNFTRSGRPAERKGEDRFAKAVEILKGMDISTAGHKELLNGISRSGKPIMRDISASSIVFEGVLPGEDPSKTVAWTVLGCPTTSVYIPLKVFGSDHIPSFMKDFRVAPSDFFEAVKASSNHFFLFCC